MKTHYTQEKNIEILLVLMKAHGINKVIVSPGSTNITLVASMQQDSYFELYSAPDERSAAYIACGLAAESNEPVALSCTGATASRNYIPGLTEAFYRKLPVLAITSTQHMGQIGNYVPQVIDRTVPLNDIVNLSVQIPIIHDDIDAWSVNTQLNKALLELRHRGGGPVHINLTTSYPFYPVNLDIKELPKCRIINRIEYDDELPELQTNKIAIFVGNHIKMTKKLINSIEKFCELYNAVVLCDHTSNYTGRYGISASLILSQDFYKPFCSEIDTLIHIGQVSGAYLNLFPKEVWRVNPDGEIRDTYRTLKYVFEMSEYSFFTAYTNKKSLKSVNTTYYDEWRNEYNNLIEKVPDLPLSNIWMAQQLIAKLPPYSSIYLGILNSLRAWNFFDIRNDIRGFSNTGGFGIDGGLSSLIGGSIHDSNKLYFEVTGDLAFFYDMNSLGNRHVNHRIRILLINNGKGTEFRNYTNFASEFGEETDKFISAAGHYGDKSKNLVKNYAENLGFTYYSAYNKEEFIAQIDKFCEDSMVTKPILFEVFTNDEDEDKALRIMRNLIVSKKAMAKKNAKDAIKKTLGENSFETIKKMVKNNKV